MTVFLPSLVPGVFACPATFATGFVALVGLPDIFLIGFATSAGLLGAFFTGLVTSAGLLVACSTGFAASGCGVFLVLPLARTPMEDNRRSADDTPMSSGVRCSFVSGGGVS